MSSPTLTNLSSFLFGVAFTALVACASARNLPADRPPKGASPASNESFVGVRVLKVDHAGEVNWSAQLPKACSTCRLQNNEFTSGQNLREFYFHFFAPSDVKTIAGIRVKVDPAQVRGVLVGRSRIPFTRTADGIIFDAPQNGPKVSELSGFHALPADGPEDVTEQYTYLETPAVETRVEHASEQRRNGSYAKGPWPVKERQAALNLEFAAREAIALLGLDRAVRERGLGTILLMGFDTNYPTQGPEAAHADYPPHWHMHVSWAHDPLIRDVGHFNIGPDGLLIENFVNEPQEKYEIFKRGATHVTRTENGETLFTQSITADGYFELGTAAGKCRFTPIAGGFQSGVDLACDNGAPHQRIRVEDDVEAGRLRLFRNGELVEEHFYDPDNGALKRSELVYAER